MFLVVLKAVYIAFAINFFIPVILRKQYKKFKKLGLKWSDIDKITVIWITWTINIWAFENLVLLLYLFVIGIITVLR